jgi:hypothetical protein
MGAYCCRYNAIDSHNIKTFDLPPNRISDLANTIKSNQNDLSVDEFEQPNLPGEEERKELSKIEEVIESEYTDTKGASGI